MCEMNLGRFPRQTSDIRTFSITKQSRFVIEKVYPSPFCSSPRGRQHPCLLQCVKILLPYSTTSSRTKALKAAVVFKNQEMVDLLASSSDAKRVYDEFVSKGLSEQAALLERHKEHTTRC